MSVEPQFTAYAAELLLFAAFLLGIVVLRILRRRVSPKPDPAAVSKTFVSPWKRRTQRARRQSAAPLQAVPKPGPPKETRVRPAMRSNSACRWCIDAFRRRDAEFLRWTCLDCDAEGYSRDAEPPTICKRNLKPRAI